MSRIYSNPEPRVLELAIQFLRWLALSFATTILMTTLAVGLILLSAWAASAQTDVGLKPCVTGHRFEPGPIVNGHARQPTPAEIEERTRELWASKASAGFCR
jgi:hypothetical protein